MKRYFFPSLLGLLSLAFSTQCQAQQRQERTEQIKKEFTLPGTAARSTLALYNVFGSVRVQGYAGNAVVVEVTKTVRSESAQGLATGQQEAKLGFDQRGDSLVVYEAGPHDARPNRGNRNDSGQRPYQHQFDFVVKVPAAMNLHVSTVNGGEVSIQDVSGKLGAFNVNGPLSIKNARGSTVARTVNGNVDATYAANPPGPSSYNTINGQIRVTYPSDVAADVYFKSMHGELYTDFPNAAVLPVQASQNAQNTGSGTKYKLRKDTVVRLGSGGQEFRFETLNGDVTIKQQPR
ncbi:hypothetical protein GCM10027048_41080 [Hymenobacter coalescens]